MSSRLRLGIAVIAFAGCTACGLKGPLYLPDRASNVEVRPASAESPPAASEQPPAGKDEASDEERRESDQSESAKRDGT